MVSVGSRPETIFDGYIFDLDGTIYLGDSLLPGAKDLVGKIRHHGRKVLFLSNNPTHTLDHYADRLGRLGIAADQSEILSSVVTMTDWLLRFRPEATVFPISEDPLKRSLRAAGIRISEDPAEIDIVLASYDRSFDYRKLQIAFDAIHVHKRARLVTTNPDRFCPFPGGRGEPDAAAIVGAIEGCTGIRCEQNTGKPDPFMLDAALTRLDLAAAQCVMVGDRLMTDIRMAIDAGMASALVLTGETTRDMLNGIPEDSRPTWVLDRIDHVFPNAPAARLFTPIGKGNHAF